MSSYNSRRLSYGQPYGSTLVPYSASGYDDGGYSDDDRNSNRIEGRPQYPAIMPADDQYQRAAGRPRARRLTSGYEIQPVGGTQYGSHHVSTRNLNPSTWAEPPNSQPSRDCSSLPYSSAPTRQNRTHLLEPNETTNPPPRTPVTDGPASRSRHHAPRADSDTHHSQIDPDDSALGHPYPLRLEANTRSRPPHSLAMTQSSHAMTLAPKPRVHDDGESSGFYEQPKHHDEWTRRTRRKALMLEPSEPASRHKRGSLYKWDMMRPRKEYTIEEEKRKSDKPLEDDVWSNAGCSDSEHHDRAYLPRGDKRVQSDAVVAAFKAGRRSMAAELDSRTERPRSHRQDHSSRRHSDRYDRDTGLQISGAGDVAADAFEYSQLARRDTRGWE